MFRHKKIMIREFVDEEKRNQTCYFCFFLFEQLDNLVFEDRGTKKVIGTKKIL